MFEIGELMLAMVVIVAGSEFFTNALEHLGQRLSLSEGLVGSVLAAVATALPETAVPIVAVLFGSNTRAVREHIGIGAILGSPLMLVSIAIALMALFAGIERGWFSPLQPEMTGLRRDLRYFLAAFSVAFVTLFIPSHPAGIRALAGLMLVLLYVVYVAGTVRASAGLVKRGHRTIATANLWCTRVGIPHHRFWVMVQLIVGLTLIMGGAKMFVQGIERIAQSMGVNVLLLSLTVIPIATEMPEKLNSILWLHRRKDTLAFSNITGAMVFQGTLLTAFGMQLAAWHAGAPILWAMGLTFAATLWTLLLAATRRLTAAWLLCNALAYVLLLALLV